MSLVLFYFKTSFFWKKIFFILGGGFPPQPPPFYIQGWRVADRERLVANEAIKKC